MQYNAKLVFKDGTVIPCLRSGAQNEAIGELVFNTSMVGYQEIATDPSYMGQIAIMTYPLIGNYGINDDDSESKNVYMSGMIVKEYNNHPSNFRYTKTLSELFEENEKPLISEVDTRMLTRKVRDQGSQIIMIADTNHDTIDCIKKIDEFVPNRNVVKLVSSKKKWISRTIKSKYHVACIDFGTKKNIIRELNKRGCTVTVFPSDVSVSEITNINPDGIFLSNGPGDPSDNISAISLVRELRGKYPMFGICLGHQIISLAYNAKTYKLKFGHRGGNHPVKNLENGKIEITSQNHSYAVSEDSLENTGLTVTHINLLDKTIEGVESKKDLVFSVQYHPESAAGPEDSEYLFDKFLFNMEKRRENHA